MVQIPQDERRNCLLRLKPLDAERQVYLLGLAIPSQHSHGCLVYYDHGLQSWLWLSKMDLAIAVECIQAKKLCNIGHLLGFISCPFAVNVEYLANAIQNQPAMKNIAVEFVKFGNKKSVATRSQTKSSSSTPPGIQLGELAEHSLSSIPLKPKDNTLLGFKHASSLTLAMLDLFAPPKANLPTQTP
jgi:hypothetical protein